MPLPPMPLELSHDEVINTFLLLASPRNKIDSGNLYRSRLDHPFNTIHINYVSDGRYYCMSTDIDLHMNFLSLPDTCLKAFFPISRPVKQKYVYAKNPDFPNIEMITDLGGNCDFKVELLTHFDKLKPFAERQIPFEKQYIAALNVSFGFHDGVNLLRNPESYSPKRVCPPKELNSRTFMKDYFSYLNLIEDLIRGIKTEIDILQSEIESLDDVCNGKLS